MQESELMVKSAGANRRTSVRWKYLNFIDYILPTYIVLSIPMLYLGINYDIVFKSLGVFAALLYIVRFRIPQSQAVRLFSAFILLVTFSFFQYIYNGRPFVCYITEASNYITAMLFFYIGVSDDRPDRTFYKKMMYAIAIVFALGLVFYIIMPSWYLSRNLDAINAESQTEYSENNVLERMRYGAFFAQSYMVSHLAVFCAAIAIFEFAYNKGKLKWYALVSLLVGLASSIASLHRASMLGGLLVLIIFFYFNQKTHRYKTNIFIIVFFLLALALTMLITNSFGERFDLLSEMLTERVDDNMSLGKALSERKFTHELMASMQFYLFGHGLGSGGVGVRAYGFPGISDMQYVKMFFENGLVGAFLFVTIILRAIIRGVKYFRYYITELAIIAFILLAMLGSNSLSIYFLIVYPFWYAVGRIFNESYLKKLKNNEITYKL
jgi:hypothetical protein